MRYWLYSEGNIIGPYSPEELQGLPAFGQGSLVCPENAAGEAADDWKPAEQVAEILAAMSVGVGGGADMGGPAGFYSIESGHSSGAYQYCDDKFQDLTSYSSALEAIESVLGACREGAADPVMKLEEEDRALLDKFDVRLSKIQEELEAARWEKNLLLEKMRLKEDEERKTRERMAELEARLKDALEGRFPSGRGPAPAGGAPAAAQGPRGAAPSPAPEQERPGQEELLEEARKVEEFSRKELAPAPEAEERSGVRKDGEGTSVPPKTFKSIRSSGTLKREQLLGETGEAESPSGDSRLKSLGYPKPGRILGDEEEEDLSGTPSAAPEGTVAAPIPGSALVYDFTVVTPRQEPAGEKVNFRIEPMEAPPGSAPAGRPAPAPSQFPVPSPAAAAPPPDVTPAERQAPFPGPAAVPAAQAPAPAAPSGSVPPAAAQPVQAAPAPEPVVFSPGAPAVELKAAAPGKEERPDVTVRLPAGETKQPAEAPEVPKAAPRKGRGKAAFLAVMVVFAAIAAGGVSFFFLGDGISLADFSLIGSPSKKTAEEPAQPEPEPGPAAGEEPAAAPEPRPSVEEPPAPPAGETPQPSSGENSVKAVEIVKNHRLPGGRGNIAAWFSNSFLSSSAVGLSEEWSATILHGEIFVVQYRLLRPKQDPLVYQFEVDVAKGTLVRGINNGAIELLDFPSGDKVTAAAAPAPKPAAKPAARPAAKKRTVSRTRSAGTSGEVPLLPLPEDSSSRVSDPAPTGFENVDLNDEKVRYIVAQESDEELF